jgi:hypothetical protein
MRKKFRVANRVVRAWMAAKQAHHVQKNTDFSATQA